MSSNGAEKDVKGSLRDQLGLGPENTAPLSSAAAADLVRRYVSGGAYTGAGFDVYGRNDPFAITSDDLIAVTMLDQDYGKQQVSDSTIRNLRASGSIGSDRVPAQAATSGA
jgi:hypothetical protein